jgi:hypothetical protein
MVSGSAASRAVTFRRTSWSRGTAQGEGQGAPILGPWFIVGSSSAGVPRRDAPSTQACVDRWRRLVPHFCCEPRGGASLPRAVKLSGSPSATPSPSGPRRGSAAEASKTMFQMMGVFADLCTAVMVSESARFTAP